MLTRMEVRPPALRNRLQTVGAVGAVAAALALFFFPALSSSAQFLYRDSGRMHVPAKRYIAHELSSGHFPEWNPHSGLGAPLVAGGIHAVQHPFNLLLVLLPFEAAFKSWVLLSFLLAGAGAVVWVRRVGCEEPVAAATAGVAFALSGPLVSASDNLQYLTTYAALPWVFAMGHGWLVKPGARNGLFLMGAAALCAAGGDPQAWGLAIALLVPYAVWFVRQPGPRLHRLRQGALAAGLAALGSLPFALPVALRLPGSSRAEALSPAELQRWNLSPLRVLELIVPGVMSGPRGASAIAVYQGFGGDPYSGSPWFLSVYLGVCVVALAALGAVAHRRARWAWIGAAVFTWMALGHHAGFSHLAHWMPVLGSFRYWEKLAIWVALSLSLAAALGVDSLLKAESRRMAVAFAAAAVAAGLACSTIHLGAGRWGPHLARDATPEAASALLSNLASGLLHVTLVLAALSAIAYLSGTRKALARSGLALVPWLLFVDLCTNSRAYLLSPPEILAGEAPLAAKLGIRPGIRVATPFQFQGIAREGLLEFEQDWRWGRRTLKHPWNLEFGISNLDAYEGLLSSGQHWLQTLPKYEVGRLGVWGVGAVVIPGSTENAARVGLAPPFETIAADPDLPAFAVALPHRPLAYLAGEVEQAEGDERWRRVVELDPAGTKVIVEAALPAGYRPPSGAAELREHRPETVVIDARADGPALLVLNEADAAGWTATADGKPVKIERVNGLVRGVWLEPGPHVVVFRYRTPGWIEGWCVMLAFAAGLALRSRWRNGGDPPDPEL